MRRKVFPESLSAISASTRLVLVQTESLDSAAQPPRLTAGDSHRELRLGTGRGAPRGGVIISILSFQVLWLLCLRPVSPMMHRVACESFHSPLSPVASNLQVYLIERLPPERLTSTKRRPAASLIEVHCH